MKGTTAKVPASLMKRFNAARRKAHSHTAILLEAVRAHASNLDQLILRNRPELLPEEEADDDSPLRHIPFESETKDDLRIRPTIHELAYFKALVGSLNEWLEANWPGATPTTQSEIFAVCLDEYLAKPKRRDAEPSTKVTP